MFLPLLFWVISHDNPHSPPFVNLMISHRLLNLFCDETTPTTKPNGGDQTQRRWNDDRDETRQEPYKLQVFSHKPWNDAGTKHSGNDENLPSCNWSTLFTSLWEAIEDEIASHWFLVVVLIYWFLPFLHHIQTCGVALICRDAFFFYSKLVLMNLLWFMFCPLLVITSL